MAFVVGYAERKPVGDPDEHGSRWPIAFEDDTQPTSSSQAAIAHEDSRTAADKRAALLNTALTAPL